MSRKISRIVLLVLILVMVNYNPDNIGGSEPVNNTFTVSTSRVVNSLSEGEEFNYVDRTITSFMRLWDLHGASVAIAREGKLIFAKGYGYVDGDSGNRIEPYNRFRIASVSKLVTAVAIMKLAEQNLLDLEGRVFGPEGILNDEYYDNPRDKRVYNITVSHLLSHQGGWTTRWGDQMF
ncbi:MAG: class A beta-lactamase-related serine hydrolase, partial [Bacteroidia bacterium]